MSYLNSTLPNNKEIKKSIGVWLICSDGLMAGKVVLQKRVKTDTGKLQSNPHIYQPTWNEKLERGEKPENAVKRGALEELGKDFTNSFDFSKLVLFNSGEYVFGGNNFISYNFWGFVTQEQLTLVSLHSGAESDFIFVGIDEINKVKSNNDNTAHPEKEIVLFDDQYETLKKLFNLKEIFDNTL